MFIFLIVSGNSSFAQAQRLADHNSIGWLAYTGTFKIKPKIAIHTAYQCRRGNGIKNWQQELFRTGVNYALRKDVSLNAGNAFAKTFPYADFPCLKFYHNHHLNQLSL